MKFSISVMGTDELAPQQLGAEDLFTADAGVYASEQYEDYYVVVFPNWNTEEAPEAVLALNMVGQEVKAFDPGEFGNNDTFVRVNAEVKVAIQLSKIELPEIEFEGIME